MPELTQAQIADLRTLRDRCVCAWSRPRRYRCHRIPSAFPRRSRASTATPRDGAARSATANHGNADLLLKQSAGNPMLNRRAGFRSGSCGHRSSQIRKASQAISPGTSLGIPVSLRTPATSPRGRRESAYVCEPRRHENLGRMRGPCIRLPAN